MRLNNNSNGILMQMEVCKSDNDARWTDKTKIIQSIHHDDGSVDD